MEVKEEEVKEEASAMEVKNKGELRCSDFFVYSLFIFYHKFLGNFSLKNKRRVKQILFASIEDVMPGTPILITRRYVFFSK